MADKPSPEYDYDPEGLTVERVVASLNQLSFTVGLKLMVETAGEQGSDGELLDEGDVLGRVVEIQWGRDGNVYLRIERTTKQIHELTSREE